MESDPTSRALRLLSLLQTHRFWHGAELASRLDVTARTLRRDVGRLRELGYPVASSTGRLGGYRLETGTHLPPLLLDDDEAVAVAVGLRYAAEAAIDGAEETSLRALTTIERLLPHRLRHRVGALHSAVTSVPRTGDDARIVPDTLSTLAAACRDHENVRFAYRSGTGAESRRHVEPHHLVTAGQRWYLLGWDHDRDDWRTFRLDRLEQPRPVGSRFTTRDVPGGPSAYVARAIGAPPRQHEATVAIAAPVAEAEQALRWVDHSSIDDAQGRSVVTIRAEDQGRLTMAIARIAIDVPVTVMGPAAVAAAVADLGANLAGREAPR